MILIEAMARATHSSKPRASGDDPAFSAPVATVPM